MKEGEIRIRVGVILVREGRILLIQHRKDGREYWLVPGGGVRYGESIADAARRELKEETNLAVTIGPLAFVCETLPPDGSRHIVHLVFLGEITGGDVKVGTDTRLNDIRFIDPGELSTLPLHPPLAPYLMEALSPGFRAEGTFLGPLWVDL